MKNIALTIAGSDSGGGAGIQADLKTFQELNVFGTSVITAVTAQNTLGVQGVYPIELDGVTKQIRAVLNDLNVKAIKTGMLFSAEIIEAVVLSLQEYQSRNIQLVIDPVMIAKGGASLLQEEAIRALRESLLRYATVVTPNIPEAEVLSGIAIETDNDLVKAAQKILDLGAKSVVMKGGHRKTGNKAVDHIFTNSGEVFSVESEWIPTKDTHGTGCTFSAAITACLAKGLSLKESVQIGKQFIHSAIKEGLNIGSGHGPTNHWAYREQLQTVQKEVVLSETTI